MLTSQVFSTITNNKPDINLSAIEPSNISRLDYAAKVAPALSVKEIAKEPVLLVFSPAIDTVIISLNLCTTAK